MSDSASTPFAIWRDWMSTLLASTRTQIDSAAVRHSKMVGASDSHTVFWFRTGQDGEESDLLTTMNRSGDVHVSPGVDGFIAFLKQFPEDVRQKIVAALKV